MGEIVCASMQGDIVEYVVYKYKEHFYKKFPNGYIKKLDWQEKNLAIYLYNKRK